MEGENGVKVREDDNWVQDQSCCGITERMTPLTGATTCAIRKMKMAIAIQAEMKEHRYVCVGIGCVLGWFLCRG